MARAVWLALLLGGCAAYQPIPAPAVDAGTDSGSAAGARMYKSPCSADTDCDAPLVCSPVGIYDRFGQLCTYHCDADAGTGGMCPDGCNKKGYCKMM
jgi:hypothetical protein